MRLALTALTLCALVSPAFAAKHPKVVVPLKSSTGEDVGTATFEPARNGQLTIVLALKNLPAGVHGVHVHQMPACDAPDFKSAGPHFDPISHQHTNVTVGADGTARFKYTATGLSLGTGQPNDVVAGTGRSFMIHEKADDMVTDPTGNAGNRIACGVISGATPPAAQ